MALAFNSPGACACHGASGPGSAPPHTRPLPPRAQLRIDGPFLAREELREARLQFLERRRSGFLGFWPLWGPAVRWRWAVDPPLARMHPFGTTVHMGSFFFFSFFRGEREQLGRILCGKELTESCLQLLKGWLALPPRTQRAPRTRQFARSRRVVDPRAGPALWVE